MVTVRPKDALLERRENQEFFIKEQVSFVQKDGAKMTQECDNVALCAHSRRAKSSVPPLERRCARTKANLH